MKRKTIAGVIISVLFLIMPQSLPAGSHAKHEWYNGYVTAISKDSIKVGENLYRLDSRVKVVQHVMVKGAIYEEPASLRDVHPGNRVTVRVEKGTIVTEIIIERYH